MLMAQFNLISNLEFIYSKFHKKKAAKAVPRNAFG